MRDVKTKQKQMPEVLDHHMPYDERERVKSKDASHPQDADKERPAARPKPGKTNTADTVRPDKDKEGQTVRAKPTKTIKQREPRAMEGPISPERQTLETVDAFAQVETQPSGRAVHPASSPGVRNALTNRLGAAEPGAAQAVTEQPGDALKSAYIQPRTRRAIQQTAASVVAQGARTARDSASSAVQAIAGKGGSSRSASRRNSPRVKGTLSLKLMNASINQSGRGVKYAVNKTADHLSKTQSGSQSNPDKAASDLAIRQAQKIATKAAQAASRKVTQAAARAAAKASVQVAKVTAKAVARLVQLVAKGIGALLAAAGPVAAVIIIVVIAAALAFVLLSPMAILAGGGGNGTPTIAEIALTINGELSAKIANIQQQESPVDEILIVYEGSEDNTYISNWPDVLSVFAVKVNMDAEEPLDVVVMDETKQALLRDVFWDMNSVSYKLSVTEIPQPSQTASVQPSPTPSPSPSPLPVHTPSGGPIQLVATRYALDDLPEHVARATSTPVSTHKSLEINVNSRSYSEMEDEYHFTEDQRRMLQELMKPDMQSLFYNIVGQSPGASLTPDQILKIRERLPAGLDVQREQIVLAAYSLVGKVDYFWGGKSWAVGWDERWGKPRKVTAKGNPSTGTTRPFGLDCSGFVAWTFLNAGIPKDVIQDAFGTGSSVQWKYSVQIRWEEIMPGDLVFYNVPGTSKGNHVAVCVGFNDEGKPLIAESPRTGMRVKVSVASKSFKYARRPIVLMN